MKPFALIALFVLAGTQLVYSKEKEYGSDYTVVLDTVNPNLAKTEAKFLFNVVNNVSETDRLKISVNGTWRTVKLNELNIFELKVHPGKFVFQFYLNKEYREIKTESMTILAQHVMGLEIDFQSSHDREPVMAEKPLIYAYAPTDTPLEITVEPTGDFLFTYPQTDGKWLGVVKSTGGIEVDGVNYPYLFWEAGIEGLSQKVDWSGSEVITGTNALSYMERISGQLGFNAKEKTDFITYWGPRLSGIELSEVKVMQTKDAALFGDLSVSDASFKIERVYLVFRPYTGEELTSVKPQQKLTAIKRSEKLILEWGGSELPAESSNSF